MGKKYNQLHTEVWGNLTKFIKYWSCDWNKEQPHTFTVIAEIQAQASTWVKEGKIDTQR